MKTNEFADALSKCAAALAPAGATPLIQLAELFASSPSPTVSATVTRLAKAMLTPATVGPTVGEALTVIAPMHEFVRLYGKPGLAKDLDSVTVLLQRFSPAGMRTFVDEAIAALRKPTTRPKPMPKEDVVQRHLRQLQQTLGNDPAFRVAYDELDHDPEVGALEIADLAKRFTEQIAKSRPAALKKIWARHHKLMSFKAKSESRDGRSAA